MFWDPLYARNNCLNRKSLTSIAVMYTMLTHPGMRCKKGKGLVHSILLVLPVNTIASWKSEFEKWTSKLQPSVLVYDFAEHQNSTRPMVVGYWLDKGGVMLISKESFQKAVSKIPELQNPGPDAIFIDEAHQCLANRGNAIYKALEGVKTKRRLLLTGKKATCLL
jgi:SNF2 family DNA or RNA helicase